MFKDLYTNTVSCVRLGGALSDWFFCGCGVRQGCTAAHSLFLLPVDWILHRTNHRGFLGATLGAQTFTDLDYADDVALLAEMLEVLLLALDTGSSLCNISSTKATVMLTIQRSYALHCIQMTFDLSRRLLQV